jgi:hypothetical protein
LKDFCFTREIGLFLDISINILVKGLYFILTVSLLLISGSTSSQVTDSLKSGKRTALLIGNGNYLSSTLANPENDARAMASVLKNIGFEVIEYENLTRMQMDNAIEEFGLGLKKNDIALFFYAGHGMQSKGFNYLIPVDATLKSEALVDYQCVRADKILALMEASGSRVNIVLLDACRDNPFERSWNRSASSKGLAEMNAPTGSFIGYATAPNETASDGSGKNGLYTSAVLESISSPGESIADAFTNVARIVTEKSGNKQRPWYSSSLTAKFYFTGEKTSTPVAPVQSQANEASEAVSHENTQKGAVKKTYPEIKGSGDWGKVVVFNIEDKALAEGLTQVGRIKATSSFGGLASSKGRENCIKDLKKQAAALGCPVVLITNEQQGGFTTKIEGVACK